MHRFALVALVFAAACGPSEAPEPGGGETTADTPSPAPSALAEALSFHASFDGTTDADHARGDGALYNAASYDEVAEAEPGIGNPDVGLESGAGRFGDALRFGAKNTHAIFYRAEDNVAYDASGWSGTVSFWLSLDPAVDLEPGFCDPIQLTDSSYNDAAVWVDFTRENPRQFRLGIFGDLLAWNPDELDTTEFPFFEERLIIVEPAPFQGGAWTHVAITYSDLGTESGSANLYIDGVAQPKTAAGISEPFTWDSLAPSGSGSTTSGSTTTSRCSTVPSRPRRSRSSTRYRAELRTSTDARARPQGGRTKGYRLYQIGAV